MKQEIIQRALDKIQERKRKNIAEFQLKMQPLYDDEKYMACTKKHTQIMIENAKNEFIVSKKVKYPEDGKCVIFTLDRLDKNSDIENGIENGKYNKTKSFVTVKRVAKSYQYSVRLIEQLSNGKLYGISNASESSLNSETKKNFLGEIKEDYIVDFSSAKSLDDAKNALASDNVGGCTKDILTGFYN